MERVKRQIVAMGGGGFSMEAENPLLDDFVLSLARRERPGVCFLAPMESENYFLRFYEAFARKECRATHLSLYRRDGRDLEKFVLGQDVIYVGGGNTANLLAVWRVHGMDRILRRAWEEGVVLAGVSAGMICWFEGSVTDSFGPLGAMRDGLGLLPFSACPHYDGEVERRPMYQRLVGEGVLGGGYAADDGAGVYFVGTELMEVVSSRRG
ncbi:MAG TPA: peptidase E, partial [Tepidisphaeraceae bacterium]|nr:peptidase E [Tepidisphaeraceae bacterium]